MNRIERSASIGPVPPPPNHLYARAGKRALDLLIGLTVLVVFGWLMILVALAVKLESRGPVLYRQERIGMGGRAFGLIKFRSMVVDAEHKGAGILVEKNDPRVTRVGRFIRKFSLDELPQVFNMLRGEMSAVGPRPGLRYQAELYDSEQLGRLSVRPGITGWAQVNGRKGLDWPARIVLDLEYVRRMSFALDLWILLRTVPAVIGGSDPVASSDYWKERRAQLERERAGGST